MTDAGPIYWLSDRCMICETGQAETYVTLGRKTYGGYSVVEKATACNSCRALATTGFIDAAEILRKRRER